MEAVEFVSAQARGKDHSTKVLLKGYMHLLGQTHTLQAARQLGADEAKTLRT